MYYYMQLYGKFVSKILNDCTIVTERDYIPDFKNDSLNYLFLQFILIYIHD